MIGIFSIASLLLTTAPVTVSIKVWDQPVRKQRVELIALVQGQVKYTKESVTDARGHARFDVNERDTAALIARVEYQNIQYFSEMFSTAALPQKPVDVLVFESKESNSLVHIADARIFVAGIDDGIRIEESILILNPSKTALTGPMSLDKDKKPSPFKFHLPKGAKDLRFLVRFEESEVTFKESEVFIHRPLMPGLTTISIAYTLPITGSSLNLEHSVSLPIAQVSFGSDVEGVIPSGLGNFEIESSQKFWNGKLLEVKSAQQPEKTMKLELEISGLPFQLPLRLIFPPLGAVTVIVLLLLYDRGRRQKSSKAKWSSEMREQFLDRLLDLERLHRSGALTQRSYQERRLQILRKLSRQEVD